AERRASVGRRWRAMRAGRFGSALERLQRVVPLARLQEELGRAGPDHDEAAGARRSLELPGVRAQLLGQPHLVLALLHMGAVELAHVVAVEHRWEWFYGLQERLHTLQQLTVEHASLGSRGVPVTRQY